MKPTSPRLGGWPLPRIGLGTGARQQPSAIQAKDVGSVVEFVLSQPQPFFDTAPLYGRGESEAWLGGAPAGVEHGGYLLASKAGYTIQADMTVSNDLSRDGILRSAETSLRRLGVDYLDVARAHDPDCCLKEALDTALLTLGELRAQGVIQAVGAGMNQWEMLPEFAGALAAAHAPIPVGLWEELRGEGLIETDAPVPK